MTRCDNQSRAFYVVQFIELPFEGIDDYVCVPYTWLIFRRAKDQKVVFAYPKDRDPVDTRDRAKRKERCDDEWRFYMAEVKYESDTYRDAERWIATRNYYGPLVKEELNKTETQRRSMLNKKLRSANQSSSLTSSNNPRKPLQMQSIKRPALLEPKKQLDGKRLKLNEAAQSSRADGSEANAEPGCSRRDHSVIIQDNQSMECRQTEVTAAASNGVLSSSQRRNGNIQRSSPIHEQPGTLTDVDVPSVAGKDNREVHPTSIMENKPLSIQILTQFSIPPEPVQEPQISVAPSMEMTCNDNTNNPLNSLKMSAHQYTHMNGARRIVSNRKPEIEKKMYLMNIARKLTIAAQKSSNLMEENESSSTRSMEEQSSIVTQNSSQDGPRVLKAHIGNSENQTDQLRSIAIISQEIQHIPNIDVKNSHVMTAVNPRNVLQNDTNTASVSQSLPNSLHQRPSFVRRLDKHQNSQAQEQYLKHSHQIQYLSKNQDNFNHDLLKRSTESNNHDYRHNSRTIRMRIPSIRQNSTHPSNPMYQTSELPQQSQSQPNQQDSRRRRQKPEIRIGISFKPKYNRKIPTLQGVTKTTHPPIVTNNLSSSRQAVLTTHNNYFRNEQQLQARQSERVLVNESLLNEMVDARQANGYMGTEPPSPYSDNEISTDEVEPIETTNNVYGTGIASGSKLADRATAAQTSPAPNHQMHPRVVLEQQMLDNFATLFTQMGNTLRCTCDMYNNLRSLIFETAKIYKILLGGIEQFNTLENSASNPPPSSNLSPQILQASGNRQTEVTARANSSNQDQHINDVVNKVPKKNHNKVWRYVLPPQHDPHDTK